MRKPKLLFLCETVTLAHIMRTRALIAGLDPATYDIHLAAGEIPAFVRSEIPAYCQILPLPSAVSPTVFMQALHHGRLPYTQAIVDAQIAEDMALMRQLQPDIVIGDFRLSLAISASALHIPYINITNITWHPGAVIPAQAPDVPITRLLGQWLTQRISSIVKPYLYRQFAKPYVTAAKAHHVRFTGSLCDLYAAGDVAFYSDSAALMDVPGLRAQDVIAGAVISSLPPGQQAIPPLTAGWPNIVISLGSSGPGKILPQIVAALQTLPVNLYVAATASSLPSSSSTNCYISPTLPLEHLLKTASLYISSGGSAAAYLSLQHGVPVLSIPSNMDQFNFSSQLSRHGVGLRLRIEQASATTLQATVNRLLSEPAFKQAAEKFAAIMANEDAIARFRAVVDSILVEKKQAA